MIVAGIVTDMVDECLQKSYNVRGDEHSENSLLKEDRDWQEFLGVIMHPSVTINNFTYRGDFNGYDVFRAICVGFMD